MSEAMAISDVYKAAEVFEPVRVSLVDGPVCVGNALAHQLCAGAGADIVFEGLVRPQEDDAAICGLLYEVYEPMAVKLLLELAQETLTRFGLLAVWVEHSKGFVPVHACSFRLRVASKHRGEGLAGMDWFIIRMKQEVPIWKHVRTDAQEGE